MLKKIILLTLTALLCMPMFADAAAIYYGFENAGGVTETQNQYYFEDTEVILVENKDPFTYFDYEDIYAGSYLLLPLKVYVGDARRATAVTDKMIKNDELTFSYKVMKGEQYVEELTIVDGKKLKLQDVPAGSYIKIPFVRDFASEGKTSISIQLVLSVNGITYQYTQTTLNCRIKSYVTDVRRNSVYGAMTPTVFKVDPKYSGEVTFDFGNEVKYTTKVKKNGLYFLNLSREPDKAIAAMYPGAFLDFYNFLDDKDYFPSTGRLEIPVDIAKLSKKGVEPSLYVYRVNGQTLTALSVGVVSFNPETSRLYIHTRSLNNYVLSNQPLGHTVTSSDANILKSGYLS